VKAIDTNVVARLLLGDDPQQSPIARAVIEGGAFVSHTVLLESAWLLGSRYSFSRDAVADYLLGLIELPTISVAEPDLVAWAISRSAERGDLADLLHIVAGTGTSEFVTFDADILKDAAPDSPIPVVVPG
jgi:predicted nucleic-acid-binding protein